MENIMEYLDRIGTAGMGFVLYLLISRKLVHVEELKREIARSEKTEERLDRSLKVGERAIGAGEKIAERLPPMA